MKKVLIMILCMLFAMSLTFAFACGGNDDKTSSEDNSSQISNSSESSSSSSGTEEEFNLDEGMQIDGEREAVYGTKSISFTETKSGIVVETWVHMGENGLYLFTQTNDTSVYYSSEKQFFENDSVEYYIDPNPAKSLSVEALNANVQVRTDCIQVRINACGERQTWYGRYTGPNAYPWVQGYFPALTAAKVNGQLNTSNGANGYSVEAFLPWSSLSLEGMPEEIALMPAFNNVDNREDTSRAWFTVKGMSHGLPTGYAHADKDGFVDIGLNQKPAKQLDCNFDDETYSGATLTIEEVDANNSKQQVRGGIKASLKDDGVYIIARVKDKVYTHGNEGIWDNDGIELMINANKTFDQDIFRPGYLRIGLDVDGGYETDIGVVGHDDYVPYLKALIAEVKVSEKAIGGNFDYRYEYVYEMMIPYATLGLEGKPQSISFAWAIKTPNENAYILDRRNGNGQMEAQDWLWADKHYLRSPAEYYQIDKDGIVGEHSYEFPVWQDWNSRVFHSDAPNRYDYRGFAADNGLFINFVQFVDSYSRIGSGGDWANATHIEMEVWNGDIGWGWDGTYFAFFVDGSHYVNNARNIYAIEKTVTVTDRGENYNGYRYMISYEIYIGFDNNLQNPKDGPYAYVQLMSYTPGEGTDGYENACMITKDGNRALWKDDGNSYGFFKNGMTVRDNPSISKPSSMEYSCETVSGSNKLVNKVLYALDYNMVATIKNGGVPNGTFAADVMTVSMAKAGLVFAYSQDSYYYFYIDPSNYTVGIEKVVGDNHSLIASNYLTASFKPNETFRMTVEIDGGKYYCTFRDTLYFTGAVEGGSGTGFRSEVPGAKFCNLSLSGSVQSKKVDTLIIGHSYMELWDNYKQDLAIVSGIGSVHNAAISGSVTEDWVKLVGSVAEYAPSTIIYNIGCNDLFRGMNVSVPENNVKSFVDGVHAVLPNCKILLISLNHCVRTQEEGLKAKVIELNKKYKDIAAQRDYITYIDIENAFCNENGLPVATWFTDGLHPTTAAYSQVFVAEINKALNNGAELKTKLDQVEWQAWNTLNVKSDAQSRYEYRGFAANDGLYINFVQYVAQYQHGSDPSNWQNRTHIEMEVWNADFGWGWGGTYFAFFVDGTHYVNNTNNLKAFEYRCNITDRGEGYADGYRYMINYEIYFGFDNNLQNPQDGPYAFVQMMSFTPGESRVGYENAKTITKDGNRTLWTDNCKSVEFGKDGMVCKRDS